MEPFDTHSGDHYERYIEEMKMMENFKGSP